MVKPGEIGFVFGGGFGEDGEPFAGAGLDESGDTEAIEEFVGAAVADTSAEVAGIGGLVRADEAAAAFNENAGDLGEMSGFVAGDASHGLDPAGEPSIGPARHEVHRILGGLHFEEGMVIEERDRISESGMSPGDGGARAERKGVDGC